MVTHRWLCIPPDRLAAWGGMAVAARPGPSDARVPCPLCGGLIHPIAGKCKHCKADLTAYHAARPAANAPLPSLHRAPEAAGRAHGRATTHTAHAPVARTVPLAGASTYDASQPVLPPRPTGRSPDSKPTASGWRSWPVVVIIVATVAIVVAIVLMVWPARGGRDALDGKHTVAPPPAPERMQTEPQIEPPPPRGATQDPWTDPPTPLTPSPNPGASAIDTDTQPDDLARLTDPHGVPVPLGRRDLRTNRRGMMMLTMTEHICRKMLQCGTDDPMAQRTCDAFSQRPPSIPPSCAAAERCLQHIDAMSCGGQTDNFLSMNTLMTQFRDCADAVRC